MKDFREFLEKARVYPFEGTPALNKHLEDEIIKVVIKWLNAEYKETYDPHGDFICPPATTIDALIRELEASLESQETKKVTP